MVEAKKPLIPPEAVLPVGLQQQLEELGSLDEGLSLLQQQQELKALAREAKAEKAAAKGGPHAMYTYGDRG